MNIFVIQSLNSDDETLVKLFGNGKETPVLNLGKHFGLHGNPYLRFGELVKIHFQLYKYDDYRLIVAICSSGSLTEVE